jgi:hypothetical protein
MRLIPRSVWLALGALALAVVALYSSYCAGGSAAAARWHEAQAQASAAANKKLLLAVEQGIQASEALRTALAEQATNFTELERTADELRRRTPLVVTRTVVHSPPSERLNQAAATVSSEGGSPGPSSELSRAALWMWNSALAGRDVPADSCSLADTSDAACAPGSGAAVEAAIANHEINARSCAVDRLRHSHLIDFLAGRGAALGDH